MDYSTVRKKKKRCPVLMDCVSVFSLNCVHSSQTVCSMLMASTHAEQQVLMKNLWLVISAIDWLEPRL